VTRWQDMTPAQVLDTFPALTLTQVAYVLNLTHQRGSKRGEPDRRQVMGLVSKRKLLLVDSTQPVARWTISSNNVRDYLAGSVVHDKFVRNLSDQAASFRASVRGGEPRGA
jgi:hypothetical protein